MQSKLRLKIMTGPLQGREFDLRDGLVIGRAETDIMVNDPKISGRHAKIEFTTSGQFFIHDLGSTNGIRAHNSRHDKIELVAGLRIRIGNTEFEVLANDDSVDPNQILNVTEDRSPWNHILSNYSNMLAESSLPTPVGAFPFENLLVLNIVSGPSAGKIWVIGYGPRMIGSNSIDFILDEPLSPENAFEVTPHEGGARFKTDYSHIVKLNGNSISTEILYAGDQISIGDTTIEVDYKK